MTDETRIEIARPYGIPLDDFPPVGGVALYRDGKLVARGWLDKNGQFVEDKPNTFPPSESGR